MLLGVDLSSAFYRTEDIKTLNLDPVTLSQPRVRVATEVGCAKKLSMVNLNQEPAKQSLTELTSPNDVEH